MPRILLIDDHEQVREMLGELLDSAGYEVTKAADGAEGLRLFRAHPVDLVITDVIMPETEGLEVISEVKQMAPSTKVIAVSGGGYNNNMSYLTIAERMGADKTISKPFKIELFLSTVKELVGPGGKE